MWARGATACHLWMGQEQGFNGCTDGPKGAHSGMSTQRATRHQVFLKVGARHRKMTGRVWGRPGVHRVLGQAYQAGQ